jgi:hypothetical protein
VEEFNYVLENWLKQILMNNVIIVEQIVAWG